MALSTRRKINQLRARARRLCKRARTWSHRPDDAQYARSLAKMLRLKAQRIASAR
jgi:hypothetical protein